jgi:hypothetical protein
MNRRTIAPVLYILLTVLSTMHCSIPRRIWSGKDIESSELHDPRYDQRVLVASLSSEFKDAVVERIRENFAERPVYMRFIGLDGLEEESGSDYDAVVIINRCVAWGMSPKVESFLKRNETLAHVIVLTTSGDGAWMPDMKGRNFDAIASASVKADVNIVADKISAQIHVLLMESVQHRLEMGT